MKSFDEILKETRLKYPETTEKEIIIRAREKYIFDNGPDYTKKNRETSSDNKDGCNVYL